MPYAFRLKSCARFHRITLSALASTFGGIVSSICLAVFRLITKHVLSSFEGAALCHFDRREKSFSDPSHSLGMTGLVPSLRGLGVLGASKSPFWILRATEKFAQAAKTFNYSNSLRLKAPTDPYSP
jgi:hypothetical protein